MTDWGCIIATLFKVRTAANLKVGLGELKNNWRTEKKIAIVKNENKEELNSKKQKQI